MTAGIPYLGPPPSAANHLVTKQQLDTLSASTTTALGNKSNIDHTHAAADISNSTSTGRALLTTANAESGRTTLSVAEKDDVTAPFTWHDHFAFGVANGFPAYETSADGVTWTTVTDPTTIATYNRLFAGIGNQKVGVIPIGHTTHSWWRATWTGTNFSYSGLSQFLFHIAYPGAGANLNSYWTEWFNTSTSAWVPQTSMIDSPLAQNVLRLSGAGPASCNSFRITIQSKEAATGCALAAIRGLTRRWGNQGRGPEDALPYQWSWDKRLGVGTAGTREDSWVTLPAGGSIYLPDAPVLAQHPARKQELDALSSSTTSALADKADTSHTHPASQIEGSSAFWQGLVGAADAGAMRTAIGAGTSNLALGSTGSTAAAGNHTHAATGISDSTAVGRSVLTAADAAAARSAIGAGTPQNHTDRGAWQILTAYNVGDVVTAEGRRWVCNSAHSSLLVWSGAAWTPLEILIPRVSIYSGVGFSIPNTTRTGITFNLSDHDTNDGTAQYDSNGIIIRRAGNYMVTAQFPFGSNATGRRELSLSFSTSSADNFQGDVQLANSWNCICRVAVQRRFAVGERIYMAVSQDSGGDLSTPAVVLGDVRPRMGVTWLSPS